MKECPHCGEEVQDMDVLFHNCSAMRENTKDSKVPFLIAGIVGSSIFALFIIYGFLISAGFIDWGAFLVGFPFGLLGGYVSYRLFKLIKTPPKLAAVGFYVISAILGLVFYFYFYYAILIG